MMTNHGNTSRLVKSQYFFRIFKETTNYKYSRKPVYTSKFHFPFSSLQTVSVLKWRCISLVRIFMDSFQHGCISFQIMASWKDYSLPCVCVCVCVSVCLSAAGSLSLNNALCHLTKHEHDLHFQFFLLSGLSPIFCNFLHRGLEYLSLKFSSICFSSRRF